jgi:peptide/nickel transport system permease protein
LLRLILRRILWSVPLLLLASVLTFVLVSFIPGDAARTILKTTADEEKYQQLRDELGLDDPLPVQYWNWLSDAVTGDLGKSPFTGQPVTTTLNQRLGVTLTIVAGATLMAAVLGIGLGVLSAVKGGKTDRVVSGLSLVGLGIPNFWLGLLLMFVFAVTWKVFPATGWVAFSDSPLDWLRSIVLPIITVGVGATTAVAAQTRDSMMDALNSDFITVMQANGFSRRSIIYRHALRNAAIPVVTVLGLIFVSLLTGVVVAETVFALPGLGREVVRATLEHDLPVIQGEVLYFTVMVIVVNLVIDLVYGVLNPRVRTK